MARGALVFKGDAKKKKKKSSKHRIKASEQGHVAVATTPIRPNLSATSSTAATAPSSTAAAPKAPKVVSCTGQITTSGSVATGHGTKFEREVTAGDALIVVDAQGQQQMRVVTMRLSNVSLNLSSAFSEDLRTPTSFTVIRKPRDEVKQGRIAAEKAKQLKTEQEERASGTFGSTGEFVFRERTEHGSYRIKREKVQGVSRGDLLSMRSKKTSDKYC